MKTAALAAPAPSPPPTLHVHVQHGYLRSMLKGVSVLATAAQQGDSEAIAGLRKAVETLFHSLQEHMAYEEMTLEPRLRGSGPAGQQRADHLLVEHARQRSELVTLLEVLDQRDNLPGIVLALQALIRDVLTDMEQEERELLRSDILPHPGML